MPQSSFPTSPELVDRSLLITSLTSLSAPHFLAPVIGSAVLQTRKRLIIILFSRYFNVQNSSTLTSTQAVSHTEYWNEVQSLLTFVYVHATKVAEDAGKILMDIDVLLKGLNEDLPAELGHEVDMVFRMTGDTCPVPMPESISFLRHSYLHAGEDHPDSKDVSKEATPLNTPAKPPLYPVVALGGTFDHLHAGHKILLSMGAWIAKEKLIVGITDDTLLQSKSNRHVMENLQYRMDRVRSFLKLIKEGLVYDIVPINDVFGPTGWDPNIQALVVSKETLGGAAAIASHRASHNLPPLETFVIDVISATSANLDHEDVEWLKKAKLSSTAIRQWIVDHNKQEEEEDE